MKASTTLIAATLLSAAASVGAFAQTPAKTTPSPAAPPATSAPAPAKPAAHKSTAAVPTKAADHQMSRHRIEEIQAALQSNGETLSVDGVWGPKTSSAMRDYQTKNGLKATGRFDHATAQKLSLPHWRA